MHILLVHLVHTCRLKKKVDIKLVNEFVAALEQLSSPELVLKVTYSRCCYM